MNCERFEDIVNDLARERMMEASARAEGLAHIADCENCATSLRDQQALTVSLRALAAEEKTIEAPPEIEGRLLLAFQSQTVVSQRRLAASHWRYWLGAAAAILLIAFATAAIGWRLAGGFDSKPTESAKSPAPKTPPRAQDQPKPDPLPEQQIAVGGRDEALPFNPGSVRHLNVSARPSRAIAATNPTQPGEIATDFIPVGYENAASLQGGGQVVRVQLPRSVLATYGLPVNMDRANERVKADVLVGTDGLAHAIRFVQ